MDFKKALIALTTEATKRPLALLAITQRPETKAVAGVLVQKTKSDPFEILPTMSDIRKTCLVKPKLKVAGSTCV